jgi:GDPmannose 4,6-dehydratase
MAKRAVITGITGQDGGYLARLLLEKGYEVHGGTRRGRGAATEQLRELGIEDDVVLHHFDLIEVDSVRRVLDKAAPDEIYNLAGPSSVRLSFDQPVHTLDVCALGTMRILEFMRERQSPARFFEASTSELFAGIETTPQDECTPFAPRSPYGVAKLTSYWTAANYRSNFGLFAAAGIMFNHESPWRGADFVTRKITLGFARVRSGQQETVLLGKLDAARDWGFAGDYVDGMWRIMQHGIAEDFVLASGQMHTVRQFAEVAAANFGWNLTWRGEGMEQEGFDAKSGRRLIQVDPALLRPGDVNVPRGNPRKAEIMLGWQHKTSFEEIAAMMAEADARRVADGVAEG